MGQVGVGSSRTAKSNTLANVVVIYWTDGFEFLEEPVMTT